MSSGVWGATKRRETGSVLVKRLHALFALGLGMLVHDVVQPHTGRQLTWADCVDGNAVRGKLKGQGLGETEHRELRSAVGGQPGLAAFSRTGGDVDDPTDTALDHAGNHRLSAQEHTFYVDIHHGVPLRLGSLDHQV